RQSVEAPVADPDGVGEAEEDPDRAWQGDRQREQHQGRREEEVVDRLDTAGAAPPGGVPRRDDVRGAHSADSFVSLVGAGARKAMRAQSASMVLRVRAGSAPSTMACA